MLLAERAGAVLSRAELMRALWPDTMVSDAAVSQCVRRARVAIGDVDRSARRIETLSRHGLRLAVPVSVASPGSGAGATGAAPAFVGRRGELARLEAELGTARAGRSRVVLVADEDVDMPAYWLMASTSAGVSVLMIRSTVRPPIAGF